MTSIGFASEFARGLMKQKGWGVDHDRQAETRRGACEEALANDDEIGLNAIHVGPQFLPQSTLLNPIPEIRQVLYYWLSWTLGVVLSANANLVLVSLLFDLGDSEVDRSLECAELRVVDKPLTVGLLNQA